MLRGVFFCGGDADGFRPPYVKEDIIDAGYEEVGREDVV